MENRRTAGHGSRAGVCDRPLTGLFFSSDVALGQGEVISDLSPIPDSKDIR
jgi:hypothetical protein